MPGICCTPNGCYIRGFDRKARKAIPATVRLLSSCRHEEKSFSDPFAGACTNAFLNAACPDNDGAPPNHTWSQLLKKMRGEIGRLPLPSTQVPQLTSSRLINLDTPMQLVNNEQHQDGKKRALLIGIESYRYHRKVDGAHRDVDRMKDFLTRIHRFDDIEVLKDSDRNCILGALQTLAHKSECGDTIVCHFSGHGGINRKGEPCVLSQDAEKKDVETLWITSDEIFDLLVKPLGTGVTVTFFMDCCHSGDMLNLPYRILGDGNTDRMKRNLPVLKKAAVNGASILGLALSGIFLVEECMDCLEPCCCCSPTDG